MCLLWPYCRGQCSKNLKQPCCMRSQSHGKLWPLLKLKFGNCWSTSKCCGSSCKNINSSFQFQFQSFQFQFHFQFHQFQIPELELELSCNSNSGIELTPTLPLAHTIHHTYHPVTIMKNNKPNKSYKQLLYIHISCKCDPPLMPMHQDPLLVSLFSQTFKWLLVS